MSFVCTSVHLLFYAWRIMAHCADVRNFSFRERVNEKGKMPAKNQIKYQKKHFYCVRTAYVAYVTISSVCCHLHIEWILSTNPTLVILTISSLFAFREWHATDIQRSMYLLYWVLLV